MVYSIFYFAGLLTGVILTRYGISLGITLSHKLRNDLIEEQLPTEQENT